MGTQNTRKDLRQTQSFISPKSILYRLILNCSASALLHATDERFFYVLIDNSGLRGFILALAIYEESQIVCQSEIVYP